MTLENLPAVPLRTDHTEGEPGHPPLHNEIAVQINAALAALRAAGTAGNLIVADADNRLPLDQIPDLSGMGEASRPYVNVKDFGARGESTDDTEAILAAVAALPSTGPTPGGTVYFPRGQYFMSQPLPERPFVTYRGAGKVASEIRVTAGSLMAPSSSLPHVVFQQLNLSTVAGHLFAFGTTGGLHESQFRDCILTTYMDGASLMHLNGTGDFLEVFFTNCEFNRQETATVPAFDLRCSAGGLNANTWEKCRANGNNCASSPFWRLEGTLGSYAHDNAWRNIVGELNRGGLVHLYAPYSATFEDVADWDANGEYVADMIRVAASATGGGRTPAGVIRVANVGTRYGTLGAAAHHFWAPTVSDALVVIEGVGDPNGTSKIPYMLGQSGHNPAGALGSVNFVTSSYFVNPKFDGTVVANGVDVEITLPRADAQVVGREYVVKNVNPAPVTVLPPAGGAAIDGAASLTLARWEGARFVSDGATWYTATGRPSGGGFEVVTADQYAALTPVPGVLYVQVPG